MSYKNLFFTLVMLVPFIGISQHKVFSFDQVQSRNDFQEWGKTERVSDQIVEFNGNKISLKIDKNYQLTVISKTNLPDKGIIYLCKDEKSNPITVMLIDDIKMYLYAKSKRFLINFKPSQSLLQLADTD